MTLFIIVSGLLLIAALAAVLYPLLRKAGPGAGVAAQARELNLTVLREQQAELERERANGAIDEAAYNKSREELERRALEDVTDAAPAAAVAAKRPVVVGVVGTLVPVLAVALYWHLGQPAGLDGGKSAAPAAEAGSHAVTPQQIAAMVERLAAKLQENPNDGEGWLMLARSYGAMGRFPESAAAYNRAINLLPPDAQTLADFADTVAMAQGRSLQGEPERIVRAALQVDPNNLKALALSGTIAFERQNYQAAIGEWRKVIALVPEGSGIATGIQSSIRDAENRMAVAAKNGPAPRAGASAAAAAPEAISGTVTLDASVAGDVAPGDTLFVFARAVDGPKIPLAMMKRTVSDLPLKFSLNDTMAMAPNFRLSQHAKVVVGARVSKSGDAMARPGDLEGLSAVVSPGTAGVRIIINSKVK